MKSHRMELPRLVEIGEKNIGDFGRFLESLNNPKKVSLISGTNVQKVLKKSIEKSQIGRASCRERVYAPV